MSTADDINAYINWTLYMVLGGLREADSLMRSHRAGIRRVADELSRRHPIAARPIYRGVLVNPALGIGTEYLSVSWSEDRDVARWFGSPESFISEPFRQMFPEARGYVLTLPAPTSRVLFHHTWARAFANPLEALALRHPHMGVEGARQIQWSLRTQQEVITEPVPALPEGQPIETVDGPSVAVLDERLAPPWTRGNDPGFFIVSNI